MHQKNKDTIDRKFSIPRDERDFPHCPDNVIHLLNWIRERRDAGEFTARQLVTSDELKSYLHESSFSLWLKDPEQHYSKLKEGLFHALVDYLKEKYNFLAAKHIRAIRDVSDDYLYYAVQSRLNMWSHTVQEMMQVLPGFYVSYRPSLRYPGAVVRGLVSFSFDLNSSAFRARELHASHDNTSSYKHKRRRQKFKGYIWRREYKYIWMDHDVSTKVARMNMIHQYFSENGRVTELHGLTQGSWAGRIYSTKVYLERLDSIRTMRDTKKFLPEVSLIPPEELDARVPKIALSLVDPRQDGAIIIV